MFSSATKEIESVRGKQDQGNLISIFTEVAVPGKRAYSIADDILRETYSVRENGQFEAT
jgi:hypothetical protein